MTSRRTITLLPVLVALAAAAAAPSSAAAQERRVVFERTGYRLTALGARTTVNARVLDARGRPVPNAGLTWRVADTAVATVNDRGVVLSRRVGRTRLWAVSGPDSASALLLVDQWAARFSFNPSIVRLDAMGQRVPVEIRAQDASGNVIGGLRGNCRSKNESIAQLTGSLVTARGAGVTYVRCTDRGIADSVRIEVRQRPLRIAIQDKSSRASVRAGESFQLSLRAFDSENGEIRDPRPTWASLDPRALRVDPSSGLANAMAPSDAPVKVVAQLGDATDTLVVTVTQGTGLTLAAAPEPEVELAAAASLESAPRSAILRIQGISASVGDTVTVSLNVRDASGTDVDPERVRLVPSDTSIVRYLGRQRVVARKEGVTYLVGTFETLTDSGVISVRAPGSASSIAAAGETQKFERPTFNVDSARVQNRLQLDSVRAAILASSPIRTRVNRMISVSGTVAQAAHAVRLSPTLLDARSGLLFGGTGSLMPVRKLSLSGDFRFGTLTPTGNVGEDLRVTEVDGRLTFSPTDWFSLRTGYAMRAQATETATQHWQFASVSGIFRFSFVGGAVGTFFGATLLPYSTYTGHLDNTGEPVSPNPTSMGGEAGLEFNTRYLSTGLTYYVERFTFPITNGNERVDQFSALRLRLGLQLGR